MKVKALVSFSSSTVNMAPGTINEIDDLVAQDLINAGYVVEVESCPTCGSLVEK